jgi:hypothetical protein
MAQIIGFNLTKISVEREKEIKGQIGIKYNLEIPEAKKEPLNLSKDKDVLSFDFKFTINYEPKMANILFEGTVLLLAEPKESKEIMKGWKKKEGVEGIRLLVYNTVLTKCSVKALELEDDLNLPSHLPLPKLMPSKQGSSYTG